MGTVKNKPQTNKTNKLAKIVVDSDLQPNLPATDTDILKQPAQQPPVIVKTIVDIELEPKVTTVSAKLYKHEKEFVDKVLEARQSVVNNGKPLTRDMNHFVRQCIRFTINNRPNAKFWMPDIAETLIDT